MIIVFFNWIFVALFEMSMKSGAYYLLAFFFFCYLCILVTLFFFFGPIAVAFVFDYFGDQFLTFINNFAVHTS